jgi:hypothetical protein
MYCICGRANDLQMVGCKLLLLSLWVLTCFAWCSSQELPTCNDVAAWQHLQTRLAVMQQFHERLRSRSLGDAADASAQLACAYIDERLAILQSAAELAARSSSPDARRMV